MLHKFIFEDGEETPSSLLLKSSFNGKNIFFSNGSGRLLTKIKELYNKEDTFYIFYDVSPNNIKTVLGYESLTEVLVSEGMRNVVLVPIICIEQIIAAMFEKYGYLGKQNKITNDILDNIIKNFDWSKVSDNIRYNSSGVEESLEHIYKRFLREQIMQCKHNSFKYDNNGNKTASINGIFYVQDCNCERKHCSINATADIATKAEQLYTMLPIFLVSSDSHKMLLNKMNIEIVNKDISQMKNQQQQYYNKIYNNMVRSCGDKKCSYKNIKV